MDIKLISQERAEDLNMPNEVFELFGKLNVQRLDRQWDYSIHYFEESKWEVFPDEAYDWQQVMTQGFALGAYVDEQLLGLAIFQDDWKKFMYLHDLKVTQAFRKNGVAAELIKKGHELALERGYRGIYTIGQDNNLAACRFYLKQGFLIGGFNDCDYRYTQQANKADIYFYLDQSPAKPKERTV